MAVMVAQSASTPEPKRKPVVMIIQSDSSRCGMTFPVSGKFSLEPITDSAMTMVTYIIITYCWNMHNF